ncbi:Acyl-CoA dehydrogenase [Paraburkholderia domus]|uniref:acyl-CoA dehydrogenase family protein n=1 Tax=Paraburkholderia domus TaxID=2793075 RepID=UPI001913D2A4|nr:acyl-CoA dehydrogenase family protein [Paraburkholderia domus]MBK5050517.1 acyl-CoA dehydrogenase family protein [Burkholderia sp. R-70006]CAE6753306.1 Acyl-CoA dehydrogenase [Paraburkholderia domus]
MSAHTLNDDHDMLSDSARKYIARGYGTAVREASFAHPHGCLPERWKEFAELGWLAMPVPEADDGLGSSLDDICVLAEELGRGLVNEPFVASAVLGTMLFVDVATPELRARYLPDIVAGRQRLAFAAWESGISFDGGAVTATAQPSGQTFSLNGKKTLVPGGAGADAFLLAAMVSSDSMGLFLVEGGSPGLTVTPRSLYDGQRVANIVLDGVDCAVALVTGSRDEVLPLIERAIDRAIVVHCAETVGVMVAAFDTTREYLTMRKQFGRAIGANQVIQHRMVDLMVEIEEARALTHAAAGVIDQEDGGDSTARRRYSAAAKAFVARAATHVWEESVQLHGAIGMTQEYVLGQFVKRLAAASTLYGGAEHQLERLATTVLEGPLAACG